ncbi:MAG: hypothetical protein R2851_25700 [Caldilineaceae bacterium]
MHLLDALALTPTPDAPAVVAFVGGGGKSSAMFVLARELAAAGKRVVTTTTTRIAAAQIAEAPAFVPVLDTALPLDHVAAWLDAHGHVMLIGRETVEHGASISALHRADITDAVTHKGATGPGRRARRSGRQPHVAAQGARRARAGAAHVHHRARPRGRMTQSVARGCAAHVHRAEVARLLGLAEDAALAVSRRQAALLAHPTGAQGPRSGAWWPCSTKWTGRWVCPGPAGGATVAAHGVPSLLGDTARPDADRGALAALDGRDPGRGASTRMGPAAQAVAHSRRCAAGGPCRADRGRPAQPKYWSSPVRTLGQLPRLRRMRATHGAGAHGAQRREAGQASSRDGNVAFSNSGSTLSPCGSTPSSRRRCCASWHGLATWR